MRLEVQNAVFFSGSSLLSSVHSIYFHSYRNPTHANWRVSKGLSSALTFIWRNRISFSFEPSVMRVFCLTKSRFLAKAPPLPINDNDTLCLKTMRSLLRLLLDFPRVITPRYARHHGLNNLRSINQNDLNQR
jgi:hypothetical protein